jgi:DNA-binding transcriptional MerR regulator
MAKDSSTEQQEALYTLTEVSEKTGISMPTLQRYKKNYQDRIPSVGKGRRQRYPEGALAVFEEIKKENIKRRGRPPKSESKKKGGGGRKPKSGKSGGAQAPASDQKGDLLTLTKVSEETGISYPTLVRYVKLHGDRIPFEGKGRSRRYHPEAVEVFQQLRSESSRGRKKKPAGGGAKGRRKSGGGGGGGGGGDIGKRVESLERAQASLEKQIRELIKQVKKPLKLTINR